MAQRNEYWEAVAKVFQPARPASAAAAAGRGAPSDSTVVVPKPLYQKAVAAPSAPKGPSAAAQGGSGGSERPATSVGGGAQAPTVSAPPPPAAVPPLPPAGNPAAPSAPAPTPAPAPAPAPAAAPSAPAPVIFTPPRSRGWIVALVAVLGLLAFSLFSVHSCTSLLGSLGSGAAAGAPIADDTVAVIEMTGSIQYDGTANSPEGLGALLDQARQNDAIKAVVLRVDSGGGTATAGEEMASLVRDFPKPVVVSSASINASAAYEISSQADYIYVAKSTEIGAIGTAMEVTDYSGLLKMLGIEVDVITSADGKDSSYGMRPLTESERDHYQHMVDQINATFIENVAEGRGMTVEEVRALATGLAFTGVDAVENGLADEVGTRDDALDKAAHLAGLDSYGVHELELADYSLGGLESLLGSSAQSAEGDGAPSKVLQDRLGAR